MISLNIYYKRQITQRSVEELAKKYNTPFACFESSCSSMITALKKPLVFTNHMNIND